MSEVTSVGDFWIYMNHPPLVGPESVFIFKLLAESRHIKNIGAVAQ
jgi:hypothetical protein